MDSKEHMATFRHQLDTHYHQEAAKLCMAVMGGLAISRLEVGVRRIEDQHTIDDQL